MSGSELAALRRASGLSQRQLAERVGLSARTIGRYEHGQRRPDAATALRLQNALAAAAPPAPEDEAMMAEALWLAAEAAAE